MGNTGYVVGVTGTHLHFAVYVGNPNLPGAKTTNPMSLYK